jgi:deltex-like protein
MCVDQCELDVYDPFWWAPFLCDETTYARELDKKDLEAKRIALRASGDEMRCPISLDDMLDESVDSSTYGGVLQMRCCGGFVSGDGFKELIQSNKPDGMPCIVKRMYHVTHDRPLDLVWISCPLCRAIHGVRMGLVLYSDEPDSHMYISLLSNVELEGANGQAMCEDTWQIDYNVGACHGKYDGVRRTAYLPDTEEGRTCLSRLILAWRRSLVFRVGHSATLGKDKQLVWNIHHKTNLRGGPTNYGYPDATYLTRLNEELDQLGVFLDPARYIPRYTI